MRIHVSKKMSPFGTVQVSLQHRPIGVGPSPLEQVERTIPCFTKWDTLSCRLDSRANGDNSLSMAYGRENEERIGWKNSMAPEVVFMATVYISGRTNSIKHTNITKVQISSMLS